ncbi:MAG: helix-turn-helix domain-containing protein [Pyrinomonadaceae bacterium]
MEPLTTKQASEILGVSRRRVIALIEQGKLKARKFSNVYMILRKDLEPVRIRKNGRPEINGSIDSVNMKPFKTIFDIAPHLVGSVSGGPSDLSTNKKYMKGFGTKEGEREALKLRK